MADDYDDYEAQDEWDGFDAGDAQDAERLGLEPEPSEEAVREADSEEDAPEASEEDTPEASEEDTPEASEALESIEYDGQTYELPAPLRDVVQAGLEAEAQRETLAQERAQIAQDREAQFRNMDALMHVRAIDARIQEFEAVDWNAYYAQDLPGASGAHVEYQKLKRYRDELVEGIRDSEARYAQEQQEKSRESLERTTQAIRKAIPDWGREKSVALTEFAVKRYGFSRKELGQITDPRLIRLFNDAAQQVQAKSRPPSDRKRGRSATRPQPLPNKAGGRRAQSTTRLTGEGAKDLSMAEWIERRTKQLAKRRGA